MKIRTVGNRMVLEINKKLEKNVSGIIIIDNEQDEASFGEIIALSEDLKNREKFSIGDKVIYKEFKGKSVKLDDKELLIIDEDDILGVIE